MNFENLLVKYFGEEVFFDYPLKNFSSYSLGGKAKYLAIPNTINTLNRLTNLCQDFAIDFKIIGNGSNILFGDKGYGGLIITTKKLKKLSVIDNKVTALLGNNLTELINYSKSNGLSGLEGLISIPATIGGAVYQNASAFNYNVSDKIYSVTALDNGKLKKYFNADCKFSYRKSVFQKNKEIILEASFILEKKDQKEIEKEIKNFIEKRKKSQPKEKSCGSVFKNGKDYFSAKLIDQAGLKGYKIGGATVSNVHANFITVEKGATASNVYALIEHVKKIVKEKFNVSLTLEVELVGEF